jgi:lactate permease
MAQALAAAVPIAAILALMVGARWPAWRAGLAGFALTFAIAVGVFGFGRTILADLGVAGATAGALAEAGFVTLTILAIIVPALAIHHLQLRSGATDVLRLAMGRLSSDPGVTALLVAWFFALFMEGAAGFGASVALAAPFLVSAGFRRVDAVVIALIGHAVGVSFGAVGTPIIPQIAVTGLTGLELSRATAVYHGLLGWLPLAILVVMVRRAEVSGRDHRQSPVALAGWAALAAVLFLGPYVAFAWLVGPELPTLGGALIGGVAFVALLRLARRRRAGASPAAASGDPGMSVVAAAGPYLVVVALVLLTRLVPTVSEALRAVTWSWTLDGGFSGSVQPLYHPGTVLLCGFLGGALMQRVARADTFLAVRRTVGQLGAVTVALAAMLALSRIMVHAGLTTALATTAAAGAGPAWPLLAPAVGALGTFVTGSATASNILLTDFQVATAERLGLSVATMAGAQGFGAAVGNTICPHNVVAAGATVALEGREGAVLRRTLWVAVSYVSLGGLVALWLT